MACRQWALVTCALGTQGSFKQSARVNTSAREHITLALAGLHWQLVHLCVFVHMQSRLAA